MVLDARQTIDLLLAEGFLDPGSIVRDGLDATNIEGRHQNLRLSSKSGKGYIVKQDVRGRATRNALAAEAAIYDRLRAEPSLRPLVPSQTRYLPDQGLLIVSLISDAESLAARQAQTGRLELRIAAKLGDALARIHALPCDGDGQEAAHGGPRALQFLFKPSLANYYDMSSANRLIGRIIQQCLIHGDIRLTNCLVHPSAPNERTKQIALVDWENAGCGDPCWDIGSALCDYLLTWVHSCPITPETWPDPAMQLARIPLATMQSAISRFWTAYRRRAGIEDAGAAQGLVVRATMCCAVSILQKVHEQMKEASELTAPAVCLVQISANLAKHPEQAVATLLGLE